MQKIQVAKSLSNPVRKSIDNLATRGGLFTQPIGVYQYSNNGGLVRFTQQADSEDVASRFALYTPSDFIEGGVAATPPQGATPY
jgi:hypothetical protein